MVGGTEARKSSKIILGKENVVLLAVSGLVLGLFRGPLGSWEYGWDVDMVSCEDSLHILMFYMLLLLSYF